MGIVFLLFKMLISIENVCVVYLRPEKILQPDWNPTNNELQNQSWHLVQLIPPPQLANATHSLSHAYKWWASRQHLLAEQAFGPILSLAGSVAVQGLDWGKCQIGWINLARYLIPSPVILLCFPGYLEPGVFQYLIYHYYLSMQMLCHAKMVIWTGQCKGLVKLFHYRQGSHISGVVICPWRKK